MQKSQKNTVDITQTFINSMFEHTLFKKKFYDLMAKTSSLPNFSSLVPINEQISLLVQQISEMMFQNLVQKQDRIRDRFQQELTSLYQQIQKLKDFSYQNCVRIDELPKDEGYQSILQDDQSFDMPSIRRTNSFLKEKVKEVSQNSTVMLQSSQISKQYKEKYQVLNDKISAEIAKTQQKLTYQHEKLQDMVNKKIEKQQKTINNILETLNQLTGNHKRDKSTVTTATLTSCKSASKLKNFFGFG